MDLTSSQLGFPILQIPRIFLAKGEGVPSFASLLHSGKPRIEDVFPIENGDIPASYASLPDGNF